MSNDYEIKSAFEQAMRDAGISPVFRSGEGIEAGHNANGKPWRFHVSGDDKGTRNGWYVLFLDGTPAGEFGNWKTGATHTWCSKDRTTLTPAENAEIKKRMEDAKALREKAQKESEGEAAKLANLIWKDATPIEGDDHPYLKRKGIQSHKLRVADWPVRNRDGEVFRHIAGTLVIPIMDPKGKIVSLQGVFPAIDKAFGRDKDFLVGGRKRGCFYVIGRPVNSGTICFAEGYATAETIHQATGWCVVVCWDAYNLPHVAKEWRALMPSANFVIAADNDQFTVRTPERPNLVENPGLTYGRMAAAEVGARLVFPTFEFLEGKPTDFNDLAEREGIATVQAQTLVHIGAPAVIRDDDDSDDLPALSIGYVAPGNVINFDSYTPFPEIDGKGKPLPTAVNLAELARRVSATVRYNVIKKDIEVMVPGLSSSVDNAREASYNELFNCLHRVRMGVGGFDGNLCSLADANQYNPVATWIESKSWDGRSRLQEFFNTVTAKRDKTLPDGRSLKETLMRRWLISAVAAAYSPNGVVARGVLTFVSKQNLGKTYWAKRLAPPELDIIADGLILNPSDKDSVMSVVSKWIVELGEVDATFRKADIAALKAFISRNQDALRRPYARTESKYARRTIFFASVNDEQFLHDPTGNTRWWTIHAVALDNKHTIDMQQVWAEVKSLYDAGESWHLSHDELEALNDSNRDHESISPMHELIDREFDWDTDPFWWTNPMLATEIALGAKFDKPTRKDVNEAAAYVVAKHGVETKQIGKARIKHWMMPPKKRAKYEDAPL